MADIKHFDDTFDTSVKLLISVFSALNHGSPSKHKSWREPNIITGHQGACEQSFVRIYYQA